VAARAQAKLAKPVIAFRQADSGLVDQSQKMTVATSAMAEKKTAGHLPYRVETRRQSFNRPNIISMLLRLR
jgi:hypothetical protein